MCRLAVSLEQVPTQLKSGVVQYILLLSAIVWRTRGALSGHCARKTMIKGKGKVMKCRTRENGNRYAHMTHHVHSKILWVLDARTNE